MEVALGCFQTRVSPDQRCLGAEENRKMPFTNHCIYHKPAHLIKHPKSVQCQDEGRRLWRFDSHTIHRRLS